MPELSFAGFAPARLGLAAHLARLARSDSLGAIVRLAQATGGGLELIDGLALDLRRPGHGDELEFGRGQEPGFQFRRSFIGSS